MKDKEKQIKFSVIDNKTGEYPDLYNIALKEDWAKGLLYCDMEGFSINEDGQLILSDECGKFVYCPSERFSIKFEDSVVLSKEEYKRITKELVTEQRATEIAKEYFEKIRNETTEKIFKMLISKLDSNQFLSGKRIIMEVDVENLTKKFGVEIKE